MSLCIILMASDSLVLPPVGRVRTPTAFEIADANASVSNISFPDEDLDVNEVGGKSARLA